VQVLCQLPKPAHRRKPSDARTDSRWPSNLEIGS
jgi:hypothetical protein